MKRLPLNFAIVSALCGGATLHGIAMYEWGMDDEAGLLTESIERNVSADEKWIKDSIGNVVAGSIYNLHAEFHIAGFIKGATLTGVAANAPGSAMTLAFPEVGTALAPVQGIGTGIIICRTNNIRKVAEDFAHSDSTGYQYPGITS